MVKGSNQKKDDIIKVDFSQLWQEAINELLSGPKKFNVLLLFSLLILAIASMFGAHALYKGYSHVYGIYREIPWGIIISGYVFFVVTSTGLCIVSSFGHVFGIKSLMPIAKRAVYLAIVTILAGFLVIFFDVENPFRIPIWNTISPNPTSNIWWMGTLYGAYLVFVFIEFILLLLKRYKYASLAGFFALVSEVAAVSNLGAVFGMLYGREFWYGPDMPVYFIISAIVSGCTAIIFFTYLGYRITNKTMDRSVVIAMENLGKLLALFLVVQTFVIFWKIITSFAGGEGKVLAIRELLFGKYVINFWFFEVLLGIIIPMFLLFVSKFRNINQIFVASIFTFIGIFFMRIDLVVVGQTVSHYFKYKVTDYPVFLSYTPTIHEIMIVVGACAFCLFSFLIGEKIFKGHSAEIH